MNKAMTIVAAAAILGWTGQAQAVACPAAISGKVTANSGCELGSTNNDTFNPLQVNLDQMFGFDDWLFAQKDEDLDGIDEMAIDIGLSLIGTTLAGTWSIDDIWSLFSDVMLVFKSGANNTDPDTYVGYLLVDGDTSGLYASPFTNTHNGNLKDISQVSAYVRAVPEPGTLALFGIGLLGFGVMRRKRIAIA